MLRLHNLYFLCISLTLTSCTVGPDFKTPEPPQTKSYTSTPLPTQTEGSPGATQAFVLTDHIKRQWWSAFQSDKLNHLINLGLQKNPTLQAAQAVLVQAEENLKVSQGGFFPSIDARLGASRQKLAPSSFGSPAPPALFNLYNASINVSYVPDIFGALRRQVEALNAQIDYQRYELEASYLTLTSNIVTTVIREASLAEQVSITRELISSFEKQLGIIRSQLRLGGASQADVLTQEALLEQAKAKLPTLLSTLAQTRHALATLIGELPSEAKLPEVRLAEIRLPKELPITLPATLVQHRPDVQAAQALLHNASAEIGVTKAQMFPQITLTGNVGKTNNKFHRLFTDRSDVFNIASQLIQPIFRGGSQLAAENAAIAAYDQAFAEYRFTVLQAFQQVADTLHALVEDAKTHKALLKAEHSAESSLKIARAQYKLGAINLVTLMSVERMYLESRLSRIQAQSTLYADTAALFQALGGDCFALQNEVKTSSCEKASPFEEGEKS